MRRRFGIALVVGLSVAASARGTAAPLCVEYPATEHWTAVAHGSNGLYSGSDIARFGNHVYVRETSAIVTYDVSDPWFPRITNTIFDTTSGVFFRHDDLLYVGDFREILVFDLTDPAVPSWVSSLSFSEGNQTAAQIGRHLVVATFDYWAPGAELLTFDMDAPGSPTLIAHRSLDFLPRQIATYGSFALLRGDHQSLFLCEVLTNGDVRYVTEMPLAEKAWDVTITDDVLYLSTDGRLSLFDARSLPELEHLSTLEIPQTWARVSANDGQAFVAAGGGIFVVDVSDATAPRIEGQLPPLPHGGRSCSDESFAYFAGGLRGLHVWDRVSSLGSATADAIGQRDGFEHADGVLIWGRHAFVTDRTFGLRVVDVTDLSAMETVQALEFPGFTSGIDRVGDLLYVGNSGGLLILDASDPRNLKVLGAAQTLRPPSDVLVRGTTAYVATRFDAGAEYRIEVFDVTDSANPAPLGLASVPDSVKRIAFAGDALLALGEETLSVFDAADLADIRFLASIPIAGRTRDLATRGELALVATELFGLAVVDVGDPTSPILLTPVGLPIWAEGLTIAGNLVYVVGDGMEVVDITDPMRPTIYGASDAVVDGNAVVLSGGTLFVTQDADGLLALASDCAPTALGISNLRAVASPGAVRLSWDSYVPHTEFQVVRSDAPIGGRVLMDATVSRMSATAYEAHDSSILPDRTYYYRVERRDRGAVLERSTTVAVTTPGALAAEASLAPIYPNPVRRSAMIEFAIPSSALVDLSVYDVSGRLVRTLTRAQMSGGSHVLAWDGRDGEGRAVGSGIYYVRLDAGGSVRSRKVHWQR